MIVVRDIFQVQFGKMREAIPLWQEGIKLNTRLGYGKIHQRLLTDVVGSSYYTLVLESTFESLAEFEKAALATMANDEWKALYQRFLPLVVTGRREILRVVD